MVFYFSPRTIKQNNNTIQKLKINSIWKQAGSMYAYTNHFLFCNRFEVWFRSHFKSGKMLVIEWLIQSYMADGRTNYSVDLTYIETTRYFSHFVIFVLLQQRFWKNMYLMLYFFLLYTYICFTFLVPSRHLLWFCLCLPMKARLMHKS